MADRYVVIVTGSRHWTDAGAIRERLKQYKPGTLVLHGAAEGADSLAARIAPEFALIPVPHPYFSELEASGGPARNSLLVALGKVYERYGYQVTVEAFPLPDSRGTRDCVRKARKAELAVFGDDAKGRTA